MIPSRFTSPPAPPSASCRRPSSPNKSQDIKRKLIAAFRDNKKPWFDKIIKLHDIDNVTAIQADASRYQFTDLSPIAFCLLDIDLYIPIRAALPRIYKSMSPGGIIIVDDCWNVEEWDGALEAYDEFIKEERLPREIFGRKLGVIRVPPGAISGNCSGNAIGGGTPLPDPGPKHASKERG